MILYINDTTHEHDTSTNNNPSKYIINLRIDQYIIYWKYKDLILTWAWICCCSAWFWGGASEEAAAATAASEDAGSDGEEDVVLSAIGSDSAVYLLQ